MLGFLTILLVVHRIHAAAVGDTCTQDSDCRASLLMQHSNCQNGKCACDVGYCGMVGDNRCIPTTLGSPCTSNSYCNDGVTNSICHLQYKICSCPIGYGEVYTDQPRPFCALKRTDAACQTCASTGGVCYTDANNALACGCPVHFRATNGTTDGCNQIYAYTGQTCNRDGSVVCVDPNAECTYDAASCGMEFSCTCKVGYVSVTDPIDPTHNVCARRITQLLDPACATCINNDGECYTTKDNNTMDGCECPLGRTSNSLAPSDACVGNHFTVDCNANNMTVCVVGRNDFLTGYSAMYAQGRAEFLECHLTLTNQTTDTYCLTLNYLPSPSCGMLVADNAFSRSYSLWINFQESHFTNTKYDICLYGYCTYYKIAKTSTGVINVNAHKKISASQGIAVRPEVDMTIQNMFRQDVEVVGARLGDLVSLSIQITVDHGMYRTLRAEICVASNMLSLEHPQAQSAVFVLDACSYEGGIFSHPMPVFVPDLTNPQKITTNFFPLPKFASDVVFFHCCVRVCIESINCAPKNCGRRKRAIESLTTTALASSGRRVKRSVAEILKEYTDSPEMLTKTVGVAIQNDGSSTKMTPVVVQNGYADDAKLRNIEERLKNFIDAEKAKATETPALGDFARYETTHVDYVENAERKLKYFEAEKNNKVVLIASVLGSGLITMLVTLLIFLVCFIIPKQGKQKDMA